MENMNAEQMVTAISAFAVIAGIIWLIYSICYTSLIQNREFEERKRLASTIEVGDILHTYHDEPNPYLRRHFYIRIMDIKEGYAKIKHLDNSEYSTSLVSLLEEGWEILDNPTPEQISLFKEVIENGKRKTQARS